MAIFASCICSEPRARVQRISDMHSKFAQGHTMCQSTVNIQSPTAEIRRGKKKNKKKKKKERKK